MSLELPPTPPSLPANIGKASLFLSFFEYFLGGLKCVSHSFAYVTYFVFLRDVWIRTQRAAVASRRATNLATHLPSPYLTANHLFHTEKRKTDSEVNEEAIIVVG
jgi:hypothetical protein